VDLELPGKPAMVASTDHHQPGACALQVSQAKRGLSTGSNALLMIWPTRHLLTYAAARASG
jgi:hypothetical protein